MSCETILDLAVELESDTIFRLVDISLVRTFQSMLIDCLASNFLTPLIKLSLLKDREDSEGKMKVITQVRNNSSFLEEIIKRDNLELLIISYSVYAARLVLPKYINQLVKNNSYRIVTWFLDNNNNRYTTDLLVSAIFKKGRVYLTKLCLSRGLHAPSRYLEIVKLIEMYKTARMTGSSVAKEKGI